MTMIRHAGAGALAMFMLAFGGFAAAQQSSTPSAATPQNSAAGGAQAGPSAASPAQLQQVEVTGTRIKRTTDFTTPTPTTVIDTQTMENLGIVNVGQALAAIPANITQYAPTTTGDSPYFIGAYIPDLRGLNPEFGTRTLTLIDNQRAVPTNSAGSFDLNLVPQILVERIDTVTGGASAAYGSGAEAGVVNIILNNQLEGGKIDGDFYQTHDSDARDRHIGAAWGHGFFDNRIHFVIGGEYEDQDGLGCQDVRSWCAQDESLQTQSFAPISTAYVPLYGPALVPHQTNPTISTNGVFVPAYGSSAYADAGLSLPNWTLLQEATGGSGFTTYDQGTYPPDTLPGTANCFFCYIFPGGFPASTIGGQGVPAYQYNQLMTPVNRGVITALLTGQVTDSIKFNANLNWGRTESSQLDYPGLEETFPVYAGGTGCLGNAVVFGTCFSAPVPNIPGNPYLTSSQWGQLASAYAGATMPSIYAGLGLTGPPYFLPATYSPTPGVYEFGKDLTSLLDPTQDFTTDLKRVSIGFSGKIGDSTWTWDAYGTYGLSQHQQLQHGIRTTAFSMATDVIEGPNGPECRVSQAGGLAEAVSQDQNAGFFPAYVTSYLEQAGITNWPSLLPYFAQGCQPLNLFSNTPLSPAALAYATGTLDEQTRYTQTVGSVDASGDIFKGIGAGAWQLAAGYEWRQEVIHNYETSCPASDVQCQLDILDFPGQYGDPFAGQVTVSEPFLEANLPFVKDVPFVHLLDVDVAARQSWYDTDKLYIAGQSSPVTALPSQFADLPFEGNKATANLTTWKASLMYEPVRGLRFRGTQSQDMRAPDFQELFHGYAVEPGALFGGTCNVTAIPCYNYFSGNIDLKPETSNTTTLGLVFTPPQLQGFELSADFFHIFISNPIYQNTDEAGLLGLACTTNPSSPYCNQIAFYDPSEYYFTPGSAALAQAGAIATYNPEAYSYACAPAIPATVSATTQAGGPLNCTGLPTLSGAQAYAHGAPNVLSDIYSSFNGAWFNERGVDYSLSYVRLLPDNSTVSVRALTTWTLNQTYLLYSGGEVMSLLGQLGSYSNFAVEEEPAARWRGNVAITWTKGAFSLTPNMSWVGHGLIIANAVTPASGVVYQWLLEGFPDATSNLAPGEAPKSDSAAQQAAKARGYTALPFNYVPSYFLFGLNATYTFENIPGVKGLQVFMQVNNLFNRPPPITENGFGGSAGGANPAFYDTIGMAYRAGFRLSF